MTKKAEPQAKDHALEQWVRTEGVARYDTYHRDGKGRPTVEVFALFRKRATNQGSTKARRKTKR
jgi:hypothetical protein